MHMKKMAVVAVCLLTLVGLSVVVEAGDLDPPGTPAPTMVTLQQIYDRFSGTLVGLPKTGQTSCWDELGIAMIFTGTPVRDTACSMA